MNNVTKCPVLVTGAAGFIASNVVRDLLARGYRVRGTVRDASKEKAPAHLHALPGAAERLELVTADLLQDGAFDRAAEGCEYVVHMASPYVLDAKDPQKDLVDPAVKGTRNVLESCAKARVKRVVLTSSMAAITDEPESERVLTEADWNTKSTLQRLLRHGVARVGLPIEMAQAATLRRAPRHRNVLLGASVACPEVARLMDIGHLHTADRRLVQSRC